jgi:hypothetical protein
MKNFFVNNSNFKCWIQAAGSDDSLYLAILPMFESNQLARKRIINKILLHFHPPCNTSNDTEKKPDPAIDSKPDLDITHSSIDNSAESKEKISCLCCGSEMKVDKVLKNTTIIKCSGCGLTDTRLNS